MSVQFDEHQQNLVRELFLSGQTHQEIGAAVGCPRRTIMKLCKSLGLARSRKEAAALRNKSILDSPTVIAKIRELRDTCSFEEIAAQVGGSTSAIHRICLKHHIVQQEFNALQSKRMQSAWTDEKKLVASAKARNVSPELKKRLSEGSKRLWQDSDYRERQIATQTAIWNSPENKERLAQYRAKQSGRVSSIQSILYSMLDDLGITYYRERDGQQGDPECIIGPYNFDCAIPRPGKRTLLIECQGDYWHTQEKAIRTDKAKSTYYERYLSSEYELKYLWEHEFACYAKVVEHIRHWMGLTLTDVVQFEFSDVQIRRSQAAEYRLLLSKYHYLPNAGKGGIAFGAYVDDALAAVCVFSPLSRQNVVIDGFEPSQTIELSRLCLHPKYQRPNFASWFVSRCIRQLSASIACIVSYCDTTFNHDGAIYKALNFRQDSVVRPDFWYVDSRGWVMHKKRLYEKAVRMGIREAEFAEQFGYKKVFGKEKLRFVFER